MTHNLIKDILRLLSQPRTGCWEEDSKKSHSPACSPHHCSVTQGRRGRVEEQRLFLPTFGLAVGCTAIVDRQRTKGRGHLPGDNCHCQSPVFLSCLILVRFCRERKDKRDFSQQSWQQLALLLSPHFSSTHTWCWAPLLSAVDWQKPPPHLSTTFYREVVANWCLHWFIALPAKLLKQKVSWTQAWDFCFLLCIPNIIIGFVIKGR